MSLISALGKLCDDILGREFCVASILFFLR